MISPNGIQTGATSTSGAALNGNGDDAVTVRNGHVAWTSVPTSSFVNEFRFGWLTDRQADDFDQSDAGPGPRLPAGVGQRHHARTGQLPAARRAEARRASSSQDNATWTKGKHIIKFGVGYRHHRRVRLLHQQRLRQLHLPDGQPASRWTISGNTTGAKNWQTLRADLRQPGGGRHASPIYGFYLQDQWRATDRLTVQYGRALRIRPACRSLQLCNHDYPQTCHDPLQPKNLAPRLGLTYRLNDKTVLQAGYGMFYARFQGGTIDNLFTTGNGVYQTVVQP